MPKAVVVFSGGLDSTVLAASLKDQGFGVYALTVDYGQRHRKEIQCARTVTKALGIEHKVLDLSGLRDILGGSALTDDIEVPHGHYAAPEMAITVVPNRNAILLSVAFGWAVSLDASIVAIGVHAGDHPVYADCRPEFIEAFRHMELWALEGGPWIRAPFVELTKAQIVKMGSKLNVCHGMGVPFGLTWSCYEGGGIHCGKCGTCVERREAFIEAGVLDPTIYAA